MEFRSNRSKNFADSLGPVNETVVPWITIQLTLAPGCFSNSMISSGEKLCGLRQAMQVVSAPIFAGG